MSKYEARLESDLAHISEKLANLGEAVESALKDASRALFTAEEELAYKVILGDFPINRASRELDKICHGFFAVHLPSAGHLRFISSVMRVNLELERIGDYAVNICREAVQIGHPPEGILGQQMEGMSREVQDVLGKAIAAFKGGDPAQARSEIEQASQVTRGFDTVFKNLVSEEGKVGVRELLCYLVIFNMFSRVADQAKNICEETVFAVTGQTKPPKSYRVLFLDEDNSTLGPMAQAIAHKLFPQRGVYESAGRQAAAAINTNLNCFMDERGIEFGTPSPEMLNSDHELADYHVVVSLQGTVKSYIDSIPFHTIALEWEVGEVPVGPDLAATREQFEALYRMLALQVRGLMMSLCGEEGS